MEKENINSYKEKVIDSVENEGKEKTCPYKVIILILLAISITLNILFGIWCGLYFTIKQEGGVQPLCDLEYMRPTPEDMLNSIK